MLSKIVFRNIGRNKKSSSLIILFFTIISFLFTSGYSLVWTIKKEVKSGFRNNICGDFVISAKSDYPMSIFGANIPAIGEFFTIPAIKQYDEITEKLKNMEEVDSITEQLSGVSVMDIYSGRYIIPFFGINFQKHFGFFPNIELIKGTVPPAGKPAIMLSESAVNRIEEDTGKKIIPGIKVKLTSTGANSFAIRELPLAGIYKYSNSGPVMDKVVLIDAQTAREINAVLIKTNSERISDSESSLLDIDADSMFSAEPPTDGEADEESKMNILSLVLNIFISKIAPGESNPQGSWQFIIIKTGGSTPEKTAFAKLSEALSEYDVQILDWHTAAGQSATYSWLMQILFLCGIVIVIITGIIGIVNIMFTSLNSRKTEIGTIRALGGQKKTIINLFFSEYSILSVSGGLIGIAVSVIFSLIANSLNIPLSNEILKLLLGGSVFHYNVFPELAVQTILLIFLINIISSAIPLSKAVSIPPLFTMSGAV